jgi:cation-transporting ATPase 13A2
MVFPLRIVYWRPVFPYYCSTAKGKLVRSILFPKPASFKMYADSFKFVGVMAVMATAGFCFSIHTFVKYNVDLWEIILNACDVVTIAVPPALPAAMTIGTEFALERLKKAKIFCISPNRWVRRRPSCWGVQEDQPQFQFCY